MLEAILHNIMKFYNPVKNTFVTQKFGENKACQNVDGKVIGSTNGICPLGFDPMYKKMGMDGHNGFDFITWSGQPIYHSFDFKGWIRTEVDTAGGMGIDIISTEPLLKCPICGQKHYLKARYWHNKRNEFEGERLATFKWVTKYKDLIVGLGDKIALSDNTGLSSGDHLHFGLKWCDKEGNGIHSNNGYYGAIDINDMHENIFVGDVVEIKEVQMNIIELAKEVVFLLKVFIKRLSINNK